MRVLFIIVGGLVVTIIAISLLGRETEQGVAERQHYDKIRSATDELQKFTGQKP